MPAIKTKNPKSTTSQSGRCVLNSAANRVVSAGGKEADGVGTTGAGNGVGSTGGGT